MCRWASVSPSGKWDLSLVSTSQGCGDDYRSECGKCVAQSLARGKHYLNVRFYPSLVLPKKSDIHIFTGVPAGALHRHTSWQSHSISHHFWFSFPSTKVSVLSKVSRLVFYSPGGGNTSITQIGQESHLHPTSSPLGDSCMFPSIFLGSVIQASEWTKVFFPVMRFPKECPCWFGDFGIESYFQNLELNQALSFFSVIFIHSILE